MAKAEAQRADWGYHPRYEAKYPFSIKSAKYAAQSREEAINDMPRVRTKSDMIYGNNKVVQPKQVRDFIAIVSEHNRQPGVFDYNFTQNFYSTHPEIEYESYVTLGGKAQRRVFKQMQNE